MAASDVVDGDDPPTPSTIERLILAQAVFEHGADAWQSVSKLLSKHPALADRPKSFFSPQSCRQFYIRLMNEASLECSEANNAPHGKPPPLPPAYTLTLAAASLNLTLAQRHYAARLLHLRELIAAEEVKFKCIVAEIDQIRSGSWDDKIKSNIVGSPHADANDVAISPATPPEPQPSPTHDLPSTDDQAALTQTSETDDAKVQPLEDATAQPPTEVSADVEIPIDGQIATTLPVQDDVLEPAPADITEIAPEDADLTTVDVPATSTQAPETTQMDVEEHAESDDRANGKSQQREGKRKLTDADNVEESLREKKRPRDDSISEDVEEPARQRTAASVEPASQHQIPPSVPNKRFQTVIGMLHSQISQHRNGNIFHNPIKNSEAPDYHDIIKRPMDLKTIKGRVKDGFISNSLEFQRDVYLMFANAMMYNRPSSDIYRMAEEMMAESEVHINTFRQTEGFIRSTRS